MVNTIKELGARDDTIFIFTPLTMESITVTILTTETLNGSI